MVWLRISPDMDFYLEMELQKVNPKTAEEDVQQYGKIVHDTFAERLKKAFPEGDFKIHAVDFSIAREKHLNLGEKQ